MINLFLLLIESQPDEVVELSCREPKLSFLHQADLKQVPNGLLAGGTSLSDAICVFWLCQAQQGLSPNGLGCKIPLGETPHSSQAVRGHARSFCISLSANESKPHMLLPLRCLTGRQKNTPCLSILVILCPFFPPSLEKSFFFYFTPSFSCEVSLPTVNVKTTRPRPLWPILREPRRSGPQQIVATYHGVTAEPFKA